MFYMGNDSLGFWYDQADRGLMANPQSMFYDPYYEARNFYQPWVFESILKQQREAADEAARRAEAIASCRLVDDVAHQIK